MNSEKTAIPEAGERKAKSADGRNVGQARAAASHRRRRWSFRWPQTAHIFRSSFEVVRVLVTSASRLIPVAAAYWWPTISGQKLGCHVAINGSWLLRSIERERERRAPARNSRRSGVRFFSAAALYDRITFLFFSGSLRKGT